MLGSMTASVYCSGERAWNILREGRGTTALNVAVECVT